MPPLTHLLIGRILIDRHRLDPEQVDDALRRQRAEDREHGKHRPLGGILIEAGKTTPEQLTAALAWQREQFALSMVGSYRMVAKLGEGGFGAVYRAVTVGGKRDGGEVALKLLPQRKPGDVTALANFQREAQVGVGLDHPHIVRTLDFGTTRDAYYLVVELMAGGTLHSRVAADGPLSENDGLALSVAILQALDHAAAKGLVHRDVKPANILFDARGTPKLADLGLAQFLATQQADPQARSGGTPQYAAPEQALGKADCDIRADLYSLGGTLFFALTGSPPFVVKGVSEVVNQHLNAAPPALDEVNRAVSTSTAALVRKLLAKRPEDRYASPAEAIADVRRIQAGERPAALTLTAAKAYAPLDIEVRPRASSGGTDRTNRAAEQQTTAARSHSENPTPLANRLPPAARNRSDGSTPLANRAQPSTTGTDKLRKARAEARPAAAEPRRTNPPDARGAVSRNRSARRPRSGLSGATLIAVVILAVTVLGGGGASVWYMTRQAPPPTPPIVATEAPPVAAAPLPTIDLLAQIDERTLTAHGWTRRDNVLLSPKGPHKMLPLPYLPHAEYDLTCTFKRIYPRGMLSVVLQSNGRPVCWLVGGQSDGDARVGFDEVGGRPMAKNGTEHVLTQPLATDKRNVTRIEVRRDGLTAFLNGKEVCRLATNGTDLSVDAKWELPEGHALGVGSLQAEIAIYRLELTEISGAGTTIAPKK